MPSAVVAQLLGSEKSVLEKLTFPKKPIRTLPSGQIQWCDSQVLTADQIHTGDILVRVCGDDHTKETVVALSEPYQRNGSLWFRAVRYANMKTIVEFSLADAGIVKSAVGWSQNYMVTTDYYLTGTELEEVIKQAKPISFITPQKSVK